jgi:uncharacterized protein YcbX
MLEQAKEVLGSNAARVEWIEGYIKDASSGPFDAATCLLTLHMIKDDGGKLETLREIRKRLKPGAPFALVDNCVDPAETDFKRWMDRYAQFARENGVDEEMVAKARASVEASGTMVSPNREEELLREAGFREEIASALLGWRGIEGDRRFALRRVGAPGNFPWLTAGRFAGLMQYTPVRREEDEAPTHVTTPDGDVLEIMGEALAADVARRYGHPVEMMQMKHGVFDEADVSVIAAGTVEGICRLGGVASDVRRFRPNILVRTQSNAVFEENDWVGGSIAFGEGPDAPAIHVTMNDRRCVMVNLDPDGGPASPEVMKAALKANRNDAGIYATVTRAGHIAVGQRVMLHAVGAAKRLTEGVA